MACCYAKSVSEMETNDPGYAADQLSQQIKQDEAQDSWTERKFRSTRWFALHKDKPFFEGISAG